MSFTEHLPWRIQSLLGYRPRGVYQSFTEFSKQKPAECTVEKVLPGDWFNLNPPAVSTDHIPKNFKEVIAQDYQEANVYSIKNTSIYLYDHNIGVISADNKVIADKTFSYDANYSNRHPFLSIQEIPKPIHRKGKCLVLAVSGGDTFYWHWMIDSLPKYGLVELLRRNAANYDYILVNEMLRPFHLETLAKLGIPESKLITISHNTRLSFDQMDVPSQLRFNPFVVQYLRNRFLPNVKSDSKKRIYVSRENARWRKVSNETEVFAMLESKYGFIKVKYEDLSFDEQLNLSSTIEATVSLVGSNQINMIFYPKGATIVELQAEALCNVSNWIIAEQCEHKYCFFEATEIPSTEQTGKEYSDIHVDVSKLDAFLSNML